MTLKIKIINYKMSTALRRDGPETNSQWLSVTELAALYQTAHGTPTTRMPAIRGVLHACIDACSALVDGTPTVRRCAKVENYLARLSELRSGSLPQGDWQLDLLEWLRSEGYSQLFKKSRDNCHGKSALPPYPIDGDRAICPALEDVPWKPDCN